MPHRDSDKIHEGLLALLGDPALRDALVRQGREDVEAPFGYRRMVRELEDVYAEGFRDLAGGRA